MEMSLNLYESKGVHESEAPPCYSSLSASAGLQNETVSNFVFAKNYPNSSTCTEQNSFKSAQKDGSLGSTSSKPMTRTRKEFEIPNKVPHFHSHYTAAASPKTYHQTGHFSSSANSRHNVFPHINHRPNTSTSYRPNDRVSNVNDRSLVGDKLSSRESELPKEITRGPRCYQNNSHQQSSVVKDEFAIPICRERYNLPDFQTEYESAKFYMIKSFNEDDIHKGIKYDVWTSTPSGNKKLNTAFLDAEAKLSQTGTNCPVFLFFSVNASGQFVGVAEMLGPVDFKKDMSFWKLDKYNGFFPIRWHIIKDVPNRLFRHITLQNNENKCVTFSRDTQEIGLKEGLEMLKIFKRYPATTCLLDDFDFYENREKLFPCQRSTERARPEQEVYSNNNYHHNNVKAREKKREMQSSGNKHVTNLVSLTKNLSLNPSGQRGYR